MIRCRRAYADPEPDDGTRVLVDAYWPRGVSREELELDAWTKELAPSDELRSWFDHDPERWDEFRRRYHAELSSADGEARETIHRLREAHSGGRVTLVFGARDVEHNNAVALRDYLLDRTPADESERGDGDPA